MRASSFASIQRCVQENYARCQGVDNGILGHQALHRPIGIKRLESGEDTWGWWFTLGNCEVLASNATEEEPVYMTQTLPCLVVTSGEVSHLRAFQVSGFRFQVSDLVTFKGSQIRHGPCCLQVIAAIKGQNMFDSPEVVQAQTNGLIIPVIPVRKMVLTYDPDYPDIEPRGARLRFDCDEVLAGKIVDAFIWEDEEEALKQVRTKLTD